MCEYRCVVNDFIVFTSLINFPLLFPTSTTSSLPFQVTYIPLALCLPFLDISFNFKQLTFISFPTFLIPLHTSFTQSPTLLTSPTPRGWQFPHHLSCYSHHLLLSSPSTILTQSLTLLTSHITSHVIYIIPPHSSHHPISYTTHKICQRLFLLLSPSPYICLSSLTPLS